MKNLRALSLTIAAVSSASIMLLPGALYAADACKPPHYRTAKPFWATASGSTSDIRISIRLEDFAPNRLICLARALRQEYPSRDLAVLIFSSHEAAQNYAVGSVDRAAIQWQYESKLHGYYFYNRQRHEEYVLIVPDGLSQQRDSPFDTRIDLPVTGTPICRLAINGRCLLEFQHIYYPSYVEGRRETSGWVTVAATIRRDGAVTNLAAVDVKVNPAELQPVLVRAAVKNLSTWHFERGMRDEAVRITYRFDGAESPLVEDGGSLQFRLPYSIRDGSDAP
jgi:hypothetical protein